jgi:hypothetical protein
MQVKTVFLPLKIKREIMKFESAIKMSDRHRFIKETSPVILVLLLMMLVARFIVTAIIRWLGS